MDLGGGSELRGVFADEMGDGGNADFGADDADNGDCRYHDIAELRICEKHQFSTSEILLFLFDLNYCFSILFSPVKKVCRYVPEYFTMVLVFLWFGNGFGI